jgi:NADH:ubiquinone oxidoreductase subunit
MNIGTLLYTWLKGEIAGTDQFGNRYYRERGKHKLQRGGGLYSRERRWVLYKGEVEASRVPPEWHAWLHHTVDVLPKDAGYPKYPWQKEHQPNMSGTPGAYRPPGSLLKGGARSTASGDYEPWNPE